MKSPDDFGRQRAPEEETAVRKCLPEDFEDMLAIINDAASAYKGVIPADCWHEPYMSREKLSKEISGGVDFWGVEKDGKLAGIMGLQHVRDVTLIRHAYVRTARRNTGIGGRLMRYLYGMTGRPVLVGTWRAAAWAIAFYEKHGFRLVCDREKDRLLRNYWSIPERQTETSVVLGDSRWFERQQKPTA